MRLSPSSFVGIPCNLNGLELRFNASIGVNGPSLLGNIVNSTVCATRIPSFQCPSDESQVFSYTAVAANQFPLPLFPWSLTKGNYGINWGNCDWGHGVLGPSSFS